MYMGHGEMKNPSLGCCCITWRTRNKTWVHKNPTGGGMEGAVYGRNDVLLLGGCLPSGHDIHCWKWYRGKHILSVILVNSISRTVREGRVAVFVYLQLAGSVWH